MWRARIALVLVLALGLSMITSAPAQAQAVRVIVDGSPVFFDQPPVVIGGRVLVPLRGVFERLGAFVQWNPGTRSILAVRGSDQVQLTIGSRIASVSGRQMFLDVPPQIVGSRTLVPLRFISESLGARVDWMPSTRVVMITSGSVAQPPPPPSGQPPVPGPSVVEGTVLRVDVQNQRLFVQRGDTVHSILITPNTAITRMNVETGQVGAISLADLRVGDTVTVTMGAQNQAILVRAQTRWVSGRIETIAGGGRTIVLSNGQVYTISDDVAVLVDGRVVSRDALRAGMEVTLRLNPQTGQVVEVLAQAGAQPPPSSGQVRITAFTHNATRPLRAGETLTVELRGTPGGQASFDIFNVVSGVQMREVASGVYRGTFTVQQGHNVANAEILGHLRLGGQEAVITAGTNITIDTAAPVVTGRFPQPGTVVNNQRPNIVILLGDQGSGIDPQSTRLMVNGQNVTGNATINETAISYVPPSNLPAGTVTVRSAIRDRAANQTNDEWAFTIGVVQGSLIRAVTVNPSTPLQAGQTLTVTAIGEPGSQASFTIEGVQQNIPMVEVSGQPGVFVGQFVVQPQHNIQNARVLVTMSRGGQSETVAATTRLSLIGQQAASPTITAPSEGTRVGAPIVISGTAVPGSQVIVRVDYRGTLL
ncbi:MAG TPA: copper amine oxidase N-terminal domain-containing protein, partial [bacterium]|nr:copper amine oxidase N-terminal domain-containing protein [bacterium]